MSSPRLRRPWAAGLAAAASFVFCTVAIIQRDELVEWFVGPGAGERAGPAAGDVVYTCPMDPSVEAHGPSKCPLCGMDLTPVNRSERTGLLFLDPSAMQRAGVSLATAEKRTLRRRVTAFGKVVAPDPAAAKGTPPGFPRTPRNQTVGQAFAGGTPPGFPRTPRNQTVGQAFAGGTASIEATVHGDDAAALGPGTAVAAVAPDLPLARFTGAIGSAELDAEQAATRLRGALDDPSGQLRPGMAIELQVDIDMLDTLVVPARAILYAGRRRLAFVDRGRGGLELRELTVGAQQDDFIEVRRGLSVGQRVVASGTFLVAAESRIRLASPLWSDEPEKPAKKAEPGRTEPPAAQPERGKP
jgi:hypothetical protein